MESVCVAMGFAGVGIGTALESVCVAKGSVSVEIDFALESACEAKDSFDAEIGSSLVEIDCYCAQMSETTHLSVLQSGSLAGESSCLA